MVLVMQNCTRRWRRVAQTEFTNRNKLKVVNVLKTAAEVINDKLGWSRLSLIVRR